MLDFSKASLLSGNHAGDTRYLFTSPVVWLVVLMRPQLACFAGKLAHMSVKVIQEKHYQCTRFWGLALPLELSSAHSLGTSIPGSHSVEGQLCTSQGRLELALQLMVHVGHRKLTGPSAGCPGITWEGHLRIKGEYVSLCIGTPCLLRCLWVPEAPTLGWQIWSRSHQSSIL